MPRNSSNRQNANMVTMFRAQWVFFKYPLFALRTLLVLTTLMLSVTKVTSMVKRDQLEVNHQLIKTLSCGLRWMMIRHLLLCKSLISTVAPPYSKLKSPLMILRQKSSLRMRSSGLMSAKVIPWQRNCALRFLMYKMKCSSGMVKFPC